MEYRFSDLPFVGEGKTKVLRRVGPHLLDQLEKNDMTAGNGQRHELVPGKGQICAAVSAKMFELASRQRVQTSLVQRNIAPGINRVLEVRMLPYEVVCRNVADGSFCKRHPEATKGSILPEPIVEFYLKTKEKTFRGMALPDDDPLIVRKDADGIDVVHPALVHGSDAQRESLVHIPAHVIYSNGLRHDFEQLEDKTLLVNHAIGSGWRSVHCMLIDFKVEFGVTEDGIILLADSLSPDEMRLVSPDGRLICKQPFREKAPIDEMTELYTEALILAQRIT